MVPVADGVGYLLDRHVAYHKQLRRFPKPLFRYQAAQLDSSVLLKEPLEMCRAKRHFLSQIADRARGLGFDQLYDLSNAPLLDGLK
jgi:hypothetical protein